MKFRFITAIVFLFTAVTYAPADDTEPAPESTPDPDQGQMETDEAADKMTGARLGELVRSFDANASNRGSAWQFAFKDRPFMVVFDEKADRMRNVYPHWTGVITQSGLDAAHVTSQL